MTWNRQSQYDYQVRYVTNLLQLRSKFPLLQRKFPIGSRNLPIPYWVPKCSKLVLLIMLLSNHRPRLSFGPFLAIGRKSRKDLCSGPFPSRAEFFSLVRNTDRLAGTFHSSEDPSTAWLVPSTAEDPLLKTGFLAQVRELKIQRKIPGYALRVWVPCVQWWSDISISKNRPEKAKFKFSTSI